nr:hypothetical protein [Tanacetum cinerariifolium]
RPARQPGRRLRQRRSAPRPPLSGAAAAGLRRQPAGGSAVPRSRASALFQPGAARPAQFAGQRAGSF